MTALERGAEAADPAAPLRGLPAPRRPGAGTTEPGTDTGPIRTTAATARSAVPGRRPLTAIPPAALAKQGVPAGLVSRGLAGGADIALAMLLLCMGYLGWVGLRFLLSPTTFQFPSPDGSSALAAFLGVQVVYLTVCWAATGRTYAIQLMGLRVVGRSGRTLHWVRACTRGLAYALFPLGLL